MPLRLEKRGPTFYVRGTVAGYRIRESTGLSDRRAAELYKARLEADTIQRYALGHAATLTLAEAAVTYLEAGGEARFLGPILDHAGPETLVSEIGNAWLNRAAEAIYPTAAPSTINRQLITPISAIVNLAAGEELATPRRFKRRREPQGRLRWITPEEAERLLAAAEPRVRTLIAFLLGSGCRPIEAFDLEVDDLHLATGEAWIWRSKTEAQRMVELPRRSVIALEELERDVGAVFLTPKGQPYQTRTGSGGQAQTAFNAARDAAGLGRDVTPYTLRHTWATWFYAATRDFGKLLDLGGWAKADTANIYRKVAPADLADRLLAHRWDFDRRPLPSGQRSRLRAVR